MARGEESQAPVGVGGDAVGRNACPITSAGGAGDRAVDAQSVDAQSVDVVGGGVGGLGGSDGELLEVLAQRLHGYKVNDRGCISRSVMEAYKE